APLLATLSSGIRPSESVPAAYLRGGAHLRLGARRVVRPLARGLPADVSRVLPSAASRLDVLLVEPVDVREFPFRVQGAHAGHGVMARGEPRVRRLAGPVVDGTSSRFRGCARGDDSVLLL